MIILLYLANITVISVPLAFFEIWIEKFKEGPWGEAEFKHTFWGKKIYNRALCALMQKKYVTPYHVAIFMIALVVVLALELVFFWHASPTHSWVLTPQLPLFGTVKLIPVIFLPAVWMGVATLEDLLWFALNWRAPDSLRRLLRKEFPWHTAYYPIHPSKAWWLPKFYFQIAVWIIGLLLIEHLLIYSIA